MDTVSYPRSDIIFSTITNPSFIEYQKLSPGERYWGSVSIQVSCGNFAYFFTHIKSSSSTTSRELRLQFAACSGWRWQCKFRLERVDFSSPKLAILVMIILGSQPSSGFSYIKNKLIWPWNDLEVALVSSFNYATINPRGLCSYGPSFLMLRLMVTYEGLFEILHHDILMIFRK